MKHSRLEIATTILMFITLEIALWLFVCAWGA